MANSFIVNKSDLDFILEQIQIAEAHAAGTDLATAIANFYGINVADAAILPAGLRTVDGSYNNLIVGQEDFGAADGLFPRLLDISYTNEGTYSNPMTGDTFFGVGNTDYSQNGAPGGNVVDTAPRVISNLISDQTVANPAAIYAALAVDGVTGAAATAIVTAITDAYKATKNANGADAAVTAATAALAAASVVAAAAAAANTAALAEATGYSNAQSPAGAADVSATVADAAMATLITELQDLVVAETDDATAQANLVAPEQAVTDAQALRDAAQVVLDGTNPADTVAYDAATLERDNRQTDLDNANIAAQPFRDAALAATNALALASGDAQAAHLAASNAAAQALTDAQAVQSALGSVVMPEADAATVAAQALADALALMDADGLSGSDETAATAAEVAFDPATAQATVDALPQLVTDAQAAAAITQATLTTATADQTAASNALVAAQAAAGTAGTPEETAAALQQLLDVNGLEVGPDGAVFIQNISPDIGLSPSFNSFMTIFGQFFDHGLDLVTKGGAGTVFIPLEADDPLIAGADGVFGTADDLPEQMRFMALTRATPTFDANGDAQHENTTTPFVDQNQTYTSHASHQVFLREYMRTDLNTGNGPETFATGQLLNGQTANGSHDGAIANWGEVKANALAFLGIALDDEDVLNVPLLAADPYGNLIKGPNGYAQLVMEPDANNPQPWLKEGTAAGITTDGAMKTGHAFLDDIAHHAAPGGGKTADLDNVAGVDDHDSNTYDNELLEDHFITGDGRGNENIALSMIHGVFHSEHNRQVEANKQTILDTGDLAFINEWLLVDIAPGGVIPTVADGNEGLIWDGDRLFQAARFSTEMQYNHLVVEEFARTITPGMEEFPGNNDVTVDPDIIAEFAHAVYRFGHSMLNSTVDRFDNDLQVVGQNGSNEQISLIDAFLNPQAFLDSGPDFKSAQAALVRGITQDLGNEIDEFVVGALRSNLLGLPLDLAALNIARGRETGTATLQEARAQLSNDFGLVDLTPYTGWGDFAANIKTPLSVINFIAAYGNHDAILAATTQEEKRDAATILVLGDADGVANGVTINGVTYTDRDDFLAGTGDYAEGGAKGDLGGLNNVDLWIGGLAEAKNEFGGFLGTTFNFLFEYQMEQLQAGDRLYYLHRTGGLNLLDQLEANSFAALVMRNTELGDEHATHINAGLFATPDAIFEMDMAIAQVDYNGAAPGRDMEWEDPIQQLLTPKVVRVDGTTEADGHMYGGEFHFRGGEHVVIGGTEGNDTISSGIGDDAIWGDGGDDDINSGAGADDVHGGTGDDVIVDPFGENVLRGEDGHDVIAVSSGLSALFGGRGSDALMLGQDASGAFGGEGNDFILGGAGDDDLAGSEGDDWVEGGEGADGIATDNSPILPNPNVGGNDVAWGQGNDSRYELEGGDDIAFAGGGVDRFQGLSGFDWAIGKYTGPLELDLDITLFTNLPNQILRDRFDQMEALSGWNNDDILRGDSRGQALGGVIDPLQFDDHVLDAEGIALIDGMAAWLDGALETLGGAGATSFRDGNILLGGAGSDNLMGRGGNDILDGDAWLNVRIRIVVDGVEYSAESMNSSTMAAGPFAGKVYNVDAAGAPDFTQVAFDGRSLKSLLLDRTISPSEMEIVREMMTDTAAGTDTAVFQGTLAEYDIEGRGIVDLDGNGTIDAVEALTFNNSFDVNGDGFISVTDRDDGVTGAVVDGVQLVTRGVATDNTDLLKNIEVAQFADQGINLLGSFTVNAPPVGVDDDYFIQEDATLTTVAGVNGVLFNDTDLNGDVLSATLAPGGDPANGTLVLNSDGSFEYTPDGGFSGTDTFTYIVSDGNGGSSTATASIVVNGVPETTDDTFAVTAGDALIIDFLDNDSDPEGEPLTATILTPPTLGTVVQLLDGSYEYTPADGVTSGTDSFTYQASDGQGGTSPVTTVTLNISEANVAPVSTGDNFSILGGSFSTVAAPGVLDNDTDANVGDTLEAVLVTDAAFGTVTLRDDGGFDYTPNPGATVTSDSFTYQARDASGALSAVSTVTLAFTAPNFLPTAVDDSYAVVAGEALIVPVLDGVLGNDSDPDGNGLTAGVITDVSVGSLSLAADGSFEFTAPSGTTGPVTFTYEVVDGNGDTDLGTVTIDVSAPPPPPPSGDPVPADYAPNIFIGDAGRNTLNGTEDGDWIEGLGENDRINGNGGADYIIAGSGNDFNVRGGTGADIFQFGVGDDRVVIRDWEDSQDMIYLSGGLTYADLSRTVSNGTTVNYETASGDRLVFFDVMPDQIGEEDFYTIGTGGGGGGTPPTNRAPVANDDAYSAVGMVPINIAPDGVLANDVDLDGDALTISLVTNVSFGTLTLNPDGSFDYNRTDGLFGDDSFTYSISDGEFSSQASVTLTLSAPPTGGGDVPVIGDFAPGNIFIGTAGRNTLNGTESADWIDGLGENDRINGNGGDDFIIAGSGNDFNVRGGTGADIFQFAAGDDRVVIRDWEDGIDMIYLADGLTVGDLTRSVSNGSTVNYETSTGDRLVFFDVNPADITDDDFLFT